MVKKIYIIILILVTVTGILQSFKTKEGGTEYLAVYHSKIDNFTVQLQALLLQLKNTDITKEEGAEKIKMLIQSAREKMKEVDFWLRYLDPLTYKKINGPLPVEWETEVFEKFEKPYRREGAGLTIAAMYMEEDEMVKDSLEYLVKQAATASKIYKEDSITSALNSYHHFFLCNRLFLLNLASIYTTGFECPDTARVIPELRTATNSILQIYYSYNESFSSFKVSDEYMSLYNKMLYFINSQPANFSQFDNFTFIKDYINPLFRINQLLINTYKVRSKSYVDYSLNKTATSIFSKHLYNGQNEKGIFLRVKDAAVLNEIEQTGKLLFYDPILSVNNSRSCASCHKPREYFTDTAKTVALLLDKKSFASRNTPSLINAGYNHLLMADGKHISLQEQARAVIENPTELGSNEKEVVDKILSCPDYKKAFEKFLQYTPAEAEISFEHIIGALTIYYSKFSKHYAPFDDAMNSMATINSDVKNGFNLFMSRAQCATCHFVPQFNGVKPPYIGSEFEVLGVPADTAFKKLSADKGRYNVNAAEETLHAFRTGSLRNAQFTKPYMHNGVFTSLDEVIDFYDAGGGAGRGLQVNNQTLSSDSLRLTKADKKNLLAFIHSLSEKIPFDTAPSKLPASRNKALNTRKIGGDY